jgi:uncharacterized protein (TIGR00725 family)
MKILTIGVMGPGRDATQKEIENAYEIGKLIAKNSWNILSGGRANGVMNAVFVGAKQRNSSCITIGILPDKDDSKASEFADVKIVTGMGEGRNFINIASCDFIVFCCDNIFTSPGTLSEFAFMVKNKKKFAILSSDDKGSHLYKSLLSFIPLKLHLGLTQEKITSSPKRVIEIIKSSFE